MTGEDTLDISTASWFIGAIVLTIGVLVPLGVIIGRNKKVFKGFCKLKSSASKAATAE